MEHDPNDGRECVKRWAETEGGTTDWKRRTEQNERPERDRFIARDMPKSMNENKMPEPNSALN